MEELVPLRACQLDGEFIEELRVTEEEKENEGPVPGNPLEELVPPGASLHDDEPDEESRVEKIEKD